MDYEELKIPRGAAWAASAFVWLADKLRAIGDAAVSIVRDDPVRPEDSMSVADVRAYAYSISKKCPGFASDLFAAADRSEVLAEEAVALK